MKKRSFYAFMLLLSGLFMACQSLSNHAEEKNYALLVNPFIGTDFTGNTYPGAQVPFGMVQLSPDNGLPGWDRISGYFYPDSTIAGFSHTHLSGTGAGDLYDISFMPVIYPLVEAADPLGIHSKFSHDNELAHAGYYSVFLDDYKIKVELTATERCGIQRYTFPGGDASVYLNLRKAMNWDSTSDSQVEVVDSVTIRGYRLSEGWASGQRVYFYTRFSKPFQNFDLDVKEIVRKGAKVGNSVIARFDFATTEGEELLVSTALSCVSMEGAAQNLSAEAGADDFNFYLQQAQNSWNNELKKIEVKSPDKDQEVVFYTALYHSMLAPTIYGDVDGSYYGPDKQVHQAEGWTNYSTFSLWDTYRAAHPLYTLLDTDRVNDMIHSFLAFFHQNKRLPVWNFQGVETDMMIGYHSVPVIVDAYFKGIGDFDAKEALQACVATANIDNYRGIGEYKSMGYIPYDLKDPYNSENWSLSKTLEYAYDDYCIARMAESLGEDEIAGQFYKRSQNYKNVFNPASSFMHPRDSKGVFDPTFNPDEYPHHICESNGWQYFFSVQHQPDSLIALLGGKERFIEKMDSMFTYTPSATDSLPIFSTGMIGQYAHGNEPSHHVIYLYNKVGEPWKTQKYVAQVMHDLYKNTPDGLCGNEDCGQMSAWYIFSAMGFYPIDPATGVYEIGTPLFPELTLHLPNKKTFKVLANGVTPENIYIQSVKLNGVPYSSSSLTHSQLMDGGVLEFEMGNKPGAVWYTVDEVK
ncbi:MAG: GH92 family glycosyl hydrolase [Phocaeicola sp.]